VDVRLWEVVGCCGMLKLKLKFMPKPFNIVNGGEEAVRGYFQSHPKFPRARPDITSDNSR
jgi:hypothetical protein